MKLGELKNAMIEFADEIIAEKQQKFRSTCMTQEVLELLDVRRVNKNNTEIKGILVKEANDKLDTQQVLDDQLLCEQNKVDSIRLFQLVI